MVPAAYVVLRRNDRVLLQLRTNTGYRDGYWAMAAAGHVEAGESVVEAAAREAAEELGLVVDLRDLEPLCALHRSGGTGRPVDERVDFFFTCRRWNGEPRIVESAKCGGLDWFPLELLPSPVVPHELVVLDHLRAGSVPAIVTFGF